MTWLKKTEVKQLMKKEWKMQLTGVTDQRAHNVEMFFFLSSVNVFILVMLRYTWNAVVDRRKKITERQGATSEHSNISSHSSNITRLASSLRTLSSLTFISGSGLSASSLGSIRCSIGDFINTGMFNFEVLDILGAGSYATLYKVRDGLNVIAAKISHSSSVSSVLRKEYAIMSRLSHPNIVSVYHEIPRGYLLECLFEDLCTFIARFEPMLPDIRDAISLGITKAVSYLHSLGIAHLDIKPDNVLLTSSTVPKLCDFGLAMEFRRSDGSLEYLHGFYGSFYSVPPEMFLLNSPIDMCKSDSWSLGVTFFIIMTCTFPFCGNSVSEVLSNQLNGNFDFPPDMVNIILNDPAYSLYMEMIRGLCNIDPRVRLSPSDALSFYWHQGPET